MAQSGFPRVHGRKSQIFVHCKVQWNFFKDITLKRKHGLPRLLHPSGVKARPGPPFGPQAGKANMILTIL